MMCSVSLASLVTFGNLAIHIKADNPFEPKHIRVHNQTLPQLAVYSKPQGFFDFEISNALYKFNPCLTLGGLTLLTSNPNELYTWTNNTINTYIPNEDSFSKFELQINACFRRKERMFSSVDTQNTSKSINSSLTQINIQKIITRLKKCIGEENRLDLEKYIEVRADILSVVGNLPSEIPSNLETNLREILALANSMESAATLICDCGSNYHSVSCLPFSYEAYFQNFRVLNKKVESLLLDLLFTDGRNERLQRKAENYRPQFESLKSVCTEEWKNMQSFSDLEAFLQDTEQMLDNCEVLVRLADIPRDEKSIN